MVLNARRPRRRRARSSRPGRPPRRGGDGPARGARRLRLDHRRGRQLDHLAHLQGLVDRRAPSRCPRAPSSASSAAPSSPSRCARGCAGSPPSLYSAEQAAQFGEQFLDADDVYYSWSVYRNPEVNCDEKRFQFEKISACEVVDELTVRFFYEKQYAYALESIGTSLTLLPVPHLQPAGRAVPRPRRRRLAQQAGRAPEQEPPQQAVGRPRAVPGHRVDPAVRRGQALRRTPTASPPTSMRPRSPRLLRHHPLALHRQRRGRHERAAQRRGGLLRAGEVRGLLRRPGHQRVVPARTSTRASIYLGAYGYTGWNLYRPQVKDIAVRKAIAMAFDFQTYRADPVQRPRAPDHRPRAVPERGVSPGTWPALPYDPRRRPRPARGGRLVRPGRQTASPTRTGSSS